MLSRPLVVNAPSTGRAPQPGGAPPSPIAAITAFLGSVGLGLSEGHVAADSFLPGVGIEEGRLVFDAGLLAWPGDLLHEAGHLAVTPASARPSLRGTLTPADHHPDGGEVEAIAWSFAALSALRLPVDLLFHAGGYRGHANGLVRSFSLGVYPGAAGLERTGLTATGALAVRLGVEPYPRMIRWLRS